MVARFLRDCREMGLTQPGAVLAVLPDDIVIRRGERPRAPRRDDEVGRALPEVVMSQLLSPEQPGASRRSSPAPPSPPRSNSAPGSAGAPPSCARLRFACLDYDEHLDDDGERRASPVLVHDMPKVGKAGCRLPIHDREAAIIRAQQARVRAAFPGTPAERLVLFPRPLKNPDGTKPLAAAHLQRAMRAWATALPRPRRTRPRRRRPILPFPRERVFPYA